MLLSDRFESFLNSVYEKCARINTHNGMHKNNEISRTISIIQDILNKIYRKLRTTKNFNDKIGRIIDNIENVLNDTQNDNTYYLAPELMLSELNLLDNIEEDREKAFAAYDYFKKLVDDTNEDADSKSAMVDCLKAASAAQNNGVKLLSLLISLDEKAADGKSKKNAPKFDELDKDEED